jgi:hypothetical protein
MGTTCLALMSFLSVCPLAIGQTLPPRGLECVSELSIPGYRALIWQARVTGKARVLLRVGSGGKPVLVDVESEEPKLSAWIKASFPKWSMLEVCAGTLVEIRFVYKLQGEESAEPRNEIVLRNANTFEIIAHPPITRTNVTH